jgi:Xaa-Pro aminopeptidase
MGTLNITRTRVALLQSTIRKARIAGLFVPRSDEFLGEYVPSSAERLNWISGFSGSWGTALLSLKKAALIVDGRYTIQAAKESPDFELLSPENGALQIFFKKNFRKSSAIGFDPWTTSIAEARRLRKLLNHLELKFFATPSNLVDSIWQDRPASPATPIYLHPLSVAGNSHTMKLKAVTKHLIEQGLDATILTDPHSVAWALNIRGNDIGHTPLALVRAIVYRTSKVDLFIDSSRCTPQLLKVLGNDIRCQNPGDFRTILSKLAKAKSKISVDANTCPEAIRLTFEFSKQKLVEEQDPCVMPRAVKNRLEQNGARKAHIRDGAALSNFLCWLEKTAVLGGLTERAAEKELTLFRMATGKLKDLSFGTISASGPNAALPHYHATGRHGRTLKKDEIYLIDSGGQYQDGTTDVTRTVINGSPPAKMKTHFTLVLKGMIAVSKARFPPGTTGVQIDTMARAALWQHGFDFDHGTGHGVGSYLSVHEGPARISKAGHVPLLPGMILSNEPGYYLKGKYGIRIENLLLVTPATKPKGGDRPMLSFETLTFAPIDKKLVDESLMTRSEIQWLDNYHAKVLRKLSTRVSEATRPWLEAACAPLTRHT